MESKKLERCKQSAMNRKADSEYNFLAKIAHLNITSSERSWFWNQAQALALPAGIVTFHGNNSGLTPWHGVQIPWANIDPFVLTVYRFLVRKHRYIKGELFKEEFGAIIAPWLKDRSAADDILGGLELAADNPKPDLPFWSTPHDLKFSAVQKLVIPDAFHEFERYAEGKYAAADVAMTFARFDKGGDTELHILKNRAPNEKVQTACIGCDLEREPGTSPGKVSV